MTPLCVSKLMGSYLGWSLRANYAPESAKMDEIRDNKDKRSYKFASKFCKICKLSFEDPSYSSQIKTLLNMSVFLFDINWLLINTFDSW